MSLPRFVQRLFANNGAGPKLRHDIIPWDEESRIASIAPLEAWRQAMIGTPMPMASTTLPPGFMWADGSFASFVAYPELKAKYDAGGFTGMLLAYNASEEDIAAYPGKFKPDAAKPTGLFVPRLNGLFARYCGGEVDAGKYAPDMGRQLLAYADLTVTADVSGAFAPIGIAEGAVYADPPIGEPNRYSAFKLDAALAWGAEHSGVEFVPAHHKQPVALYLGRAAQI